MSSIILSTIRDLGRILACHQDDAIAVAKSEKSARASFSRRGLFVAAGALATGLVVSEVAPIAEPLTLSGMKRPSSWADYLNRYIAQARAAGWAVAFDPTSSVLNLSRDVAVPEFSYSIVRINGEA